ncbi:MAG: mechanosensitive ion channel [Myxococcales bacterium]|nr:mechanosensitive ion channel [Myxococcales bacterium]MCB9543471.1 mechanosensitive ion channel [Myxococcales bacterium]MCB9551058.1 mechanosensitive ion channel [Myxococcales bacterium]
MRAVIVFAVVALWAPVFAAPAFAAPDAGAPDAAARDGGAADAGSADAAAVVSPSADVDAAIGRRLGAAFSTIEALAAVEVAVFAGVVTLDGTVATARAREAAEDIAGKIEGVLYVQNRLALARGDGEADAATLRTEADEAIAEQLRAIFENAPDLSEVRVAVTRGVVQLAGTAPSEQAQASAEKVAAGLAGVVYVSNQIVLEVADVSDRVGPLMKKLREQGRHAIELLPILGIALVVFVLFYLLARALRAWDRPFRLLSNNVLARAIVRQVVFAAILVVGLLLALEIAGATAIVGAVLGTAGVLGLALGFALQDIVQNYISGVMLSLRQPFEPHDFVQIGEHQGAIIKLTTRETLLMTPDGNHLRIPNSTVYGSVLINFTRNPERRFDFAVGVGTDEDLVEAQRIGLEILREMEGVLDEPKPMARVEELGDSTVNLRFYGWVNQKQVDYGKTKSVAIRKVKVAFDLAGIDMPVPIQRVDVVQVSEAAVAGAQQKRERLLASAQESVARRAATAAVDDISPDTVLEAKVDEERAGDRDDLLARGK